MTDAFYFTLRQTSQHRAIIVCVTTFLIVKHAMSSTFSAVCELSAGPALEARIRDPWVPVGGPPVKGERGAPVACLPSSRRGGRLAASRRLVSWL
ncbi:hypothetical protein SKAU_G00203430 [Synaphobranchus kaupii]|uniref:Uncharacterized protein n=1 Tax=Synaphobranchus kaupii TaxID=118154 RepID=A0A9Q1IXI5_SYNKA|nr:hypothetical protein SKAU_G00203430 [Synaphobranchus kaupii]